MLHKKSEYRIQYNKLNTDLRRQIWQDNIDLRKSRSQSNQATHYWEYQLRYDVCDCENGEEEEQEEPLPPHRQKHKNLRQQYSQQTDRLCSSLPQNIGKEKDAREIAVQTPEWNGKDSDKRLGSNSDGGLARDLSSLALPVGKDIHHSAATTKPSLVRPRTAVSLTRPSRTSRKLVTETKQTHFAPYGWNEAKTDVGKKQTYNVCAPKKEVHDSAMIASQRRRAEIEISLAQEKLVKHQTRPRERTCSNSSSMWMSEYQDQFSARGGSRSSRPLSAPPAPRHPATWRHS